MLQVVEGVGTPTLLQDKEMFSFQGVTMLRLNEVILAGTEMNKAEVSFRIKPKELFGLVFLCNVRLLSIRDEINRFAKEERIFYPAIT